MVMGLCRRGTIKGSGRRSPREGEEMSMSHIILEYLGKQYSLDYDWGKEYPEDAAIFMWAEGNYSCDCNRSLFIKRLCDDTFPEMECGDTIKMISHKFDAEGNP
jgi:hypothetical protein